MDDRNLADPVRGAQDQGIEVGVNGVHGAEPPRQVAAPSIRASRTTRPRSPAGWWGGTEVDS